MLKNNVKLFDPSCFDDPVASKTQWTPVNGGGADFQTHILHKISPQRIEFKITSGIRLASLLPFFLGAATLAFTIYAGIEINSYTGTLFLTGLGIGVCLTIVGILLFFHFRIPITFDKSVGYFYKGHKEKVLNSGRISKDCTPIKDIAGLQIISELLEKEENLRDSNTGEVYKGRAWYYSHELNLVLTEGERINIVDHGDIDKIRENASVLSEFLDIPIWDATLHYT